jgi:hypothetical protein
MATDDSIRASTGVVCCLRELPSGEVRLTIDDVANQSSSTSGSWEHRALFTCKDFEAKAITGLQLSEHELAELGLNILVRLVAHGKGSARSGGAV